ncbi:MAG: FAD-dependent monooxygenase [Bacteroidales bacterium]|nr:FAD-dependent monooxygenase [Bacteroidales bacterium]MBN2817439.1 FAD-dependent monooxygenase [Bacteroidales bacterium]
MGYLEIDIRVPVGMEEEELQFQLSKKTGIEKFSFSILLKSLDARNKRNIAWQYRVGITSDEIITGNIPDIPQLELPVKRYKEKAIVAGSGPAGIFTALVLAESGMQVTLIERGSSVRNRKNAIDHFEQTKEFSEQNNYAFGEGGAGTFSDGKLTSRTKGISKEKNFIFQKFIKCGGPQEIMYMTHPHLGSDNLLGITEKLRAELINLGGNILFDTLVTGIKKVDDEVTGVETETGVFEADYVVFAPGHSAYETYRMLIRAGIPFQTKNFAIGMRAEHKQELINRAQWGVKSLPGVKAAEYRLTASDEANKPVYSFCMCPGGIVVPSTAYKNSNTVNGMSLYKRNNNMANAAVVAGLHPDEVLGVDTSVLATLDWLETLEQKFFNYAKSYDAPAVRIQDFINNKVSQNFPESSYPFSLLSADLNELLPKRIIESLKTGLQNFSKKLRGYEDGVLIGLESKTSSPIQVLRDRDRLNAGFVNFYIAGEGSGWAGGIVSSAADGIKVAMKILEVAR